jgi:hypothetical protein
MQSIIRSTRRPAGATAARRFQIAATALALSAIALIPLSVVSGVARAATFGTHLGTQPLVGAPNNPYDCTRYFTAIAGVLPIVGPTGQLATSCIWSDFSDEGASVSMTPPITGVATVTEVRVAVGATTGPMQVVVMRALYRNTTTPGKPDDACCFPVGASPVFTPQAGAVTTVPVDLQLREDLTPAADDTTTIADFDSLGLAVLEPGVPVPMYYTGDANVADFLWNSATPSTTTPGFYSDTGGFWVAMNADYTFGAQGQAAVAPHVLAPVEPSHRGGLPRFPCLMTMVCLSPLTVFP